MSSLRLGKVLVWLLLGGVNQVRKLDRVLNEKNRNVIPYNVPVPLFRVELYGKPRTSRARSAEPLLPATVEKRTNAGVFSPTL